MTVNVTLVGLDETQRALAAMSKTAVPRAARDLVNSLAFAAREAWQGEMRRSLTLRNRFTERRALVERASTLKISNMRAVLGHTEPYMALLEQGGREQAAKRHRPIPTEVAAGQPMGSLRGGRKQAVKRASIITRLGRIHRSRTGQNARAIRASVASGRRLVVLQLGPRMGVFRVKGRNGKRKGAKLIKLYDLSRPSTPVPRTPTLEPALDAAIRKGPSLAHAAMMRELARIGVKAT